MCIKLNILIRWGYSFCYSKHTLYNLLYYVLTYDLAFTWFNVMQDCGQPGFTLAERTRFGTILKECVISSENLCFHDLGWWNHDLQPNGFSMRLLLVGKKVEPRQLVPKISTSFPIFFSHLFSFHQKEESRFFQFSHYILFCSTFLLVEKRL